MNLSYYNPERMPPEMPEQLGAKPKPKPRKSPAPASTTSVSWIPTSIAIVAVGALAYLLIARARSGDLPWQGAA